MRTLHITVHLLTPDTQAQLLISQWYFRQPTMQLDVQIQIQTDFYYYYNRVHYPTRDLKEGESC